MEMCLTISSDDIEEAVVFWLKNKHKINVNPDNLDFYITENQITGVSMSGGMYTGVPKSGSRPYIKIFIDNEGIGVIFKDNDPLTKKLNPINPPVSFDKIIKGEAGISLDISEEGP